jgi:alpha-D-xyloside xylohydrolase
VLLVQTNIGIVVPMLISTKRYAIMWDVYSKMTFQDDAAGAAFWAESAPQGSDYYFIAGQDMDGVIAGYRNLTGAAPMFPKSAFGLFMSKERYTKQDELLDVARNFRKDGFPIDYIVQDWQYWGGRDGSWGGMTWDKKRFPDPAGLIKTLHDELRVKLMVSIWPSIGSDTELFRELDSKGLLFAPIQWICKKGKTYDAYNPEARSIYFKHLKKGLLDIGVDAFWMDATEPENGGDTHNPAVAEAQIKALGTNAMGDFTRYLNPYSLETTRGVYEGQRATGDKRAFTLTRSAFTGQQRYAALPWSGDTVSGWNTFGNQIAGGINVAMAGQPYWTQDTGGFIVPEAYRDGESRSPEFHELFARWNQFSIFNPIYRIHGAFVKREPYHFRDTEPEFYKSLRDAATLRYQLLPYIYSLAWMSTDEGYTMMRGLPMDFPDDLKARSIDDEFLFGPAFLVHPITRPIFHPDVTAKTIPADVFQTPDGASGIAAEYFQGTDLANPSGKSIDPNVDYTWPGPSLVNWPAGLDSGNNFSGRWVGTITAPEDGEYEIGVEGDDGFRLWLGDKLLVEDWNVRERPLYKGAKVTLRKGEKVAVKLEYFQKDRRRMLRLAWRTPSQIAADDRNASDKSTSTYLPAGADWYDFWTNERFSGNTTVKRDYPLDIFPLYVRAGSIVPFGPEVQYATEKPDAPYEIRIYPGADAKFTIYEDDNETYAYEKGQRATYELSWQDSSRTLSIGARKGSFPGMVKNRELRIVVASPGKNAGLEGPVDAKTVMYTGEPLQINLGNEQPKQSPASKP